MEVHYVDTWSSESRQSLGHDIVLGRGEKFMQYYYY